MNTMHVAAGHDAWFRAGVQKALDKIDRGEGEFIEHDVLFDELETYAARRAAERGADRD